MYVCMQIRIISGLWMEEKNEWQMNSRGCLLGPPFWWNY